ncbi:MAG: DUF5681 domain-containing protein [Algiphilus sp.]
MAAETSGGKQRGRPFQPGQSGNPAGRPKGSGPSARLRDAIHKEAPDIIAALVKKAKEGDAAAARVLLDKVLPGLRSEAAPVAVPDMDAGSLTERAQAALNAAARGELPPDTAAQLVGAVGALGRLTEIDEIERRLAALEEKQ